MPCLIYRPCQCAPSLKKARNTMDNGGKGAGEALTGFDSFTAPETPDVDGRPATDPEKTASCLKTPPPQGRSFYLAPHLASLPQT